MRRIYSASLLWVLLCVIPAATSAQQPQEGYRVSGIVVNDSTGEPLANCSVHLVAREQQNESRTSQASSTSQQDAQTDQNGYFLFQHVLRGMYRLLAEKRGFPPRAYEEHGFFSSAIVTGPGQDTGNLIFRLIPSSIIFGYVVDEASEPIRDAQLQLYRAKPHSGEEPGWQRINQTRTDDRGRFEFSSLTPGDYLLEVNARPWYADHSVRQDPGSATDQPVNPKLDVTYPATYYPGITNPDEAEPLTLKGGNQLEADFTLSPVPAVHLQIQMPPGNANRNLLYMIRQKSPDGSTSYMGVAGQRTPSGMIELTGLAPGKYELQISRMHPGTAVGRTVESSREINLSGFTTIGDKPDSSATEDTAILGKVLLPPGISPQGRAIVRFEPIHSSTNSAEQSQTVTAGQDGVFQTSLSAGQYRVLVMGEGAVYIGQMAADGAKISGRTITIQSGQQNVQLVIQMATGMASLEGFVQRGDKAVSAVAVALVPEDPNASVELQRQDQSNSDGSFELQRIIPGRYYLVAVERGWEIDWTNASSIRPYLAHALLVDIKPRDHLHQNIQAQPR